MKPVLVGLVWALGVASAAVGRASTENTAQLVLTPTFAGGGGIYEEEKTGVGPQNAGGSTTGSGNTTLDGSTHVEYGIIKNFVSASGAASAVSRGTFRDDVTITSPGVPIGTPGTLTYGIYVNGLLQATSGASSASFLLQADLGGGAFDINRGGTLLSPSLGGTYTGDSLGMTYEATISFLYGIAMPLTVEMTASNSVSFDISGAGSATANFLNSLSWAGISAVTANGSPVASFSATGGSGTSWAAAVPEPASLGVLGISVALLAIRRRQR